MAMAFGFTAIPAEAAPPPQVDYVALGDSYTAGTGAGAAYRPAGVACWQSQPGYVDDVGKTGRVNLVANAACHGAVLTTASPAYDTAIITPTVDQQLTGLIFAQKISPATELVSITAGANDLGFASVLGACALFNEQVCAGAVGQATSPTALGMLGAELVQTYAAIHAVAPNARIAVMGYPRLFDPASPFAPIPAANQQLMNQGTATVNATIAAAASMANTLHQVNAQYVDVTAAFAGHAVNSTDPWIVLDPAQPTADYNFHPNKAGHSLGYAATLMTAVKPAQLVRR
jgi:lysophospholipase L1-like esterase